jgi:hypothetical protein
MINQIQGGKTMKEDLIGLSLSFCIRDILQKKVNVDQVKYIIAGFNVDNSQKLIYAIQRYKRVYWRDFTYTEIVPVVLDLWFNDKIYYLANNQFMNISSGHWAKII